LPPISINKTKILTVNNNLLKMSWRRRISLTMLTKHGQLLLHCFK
jgi:hypothetical protein